MDRIIEIQKELDEMRRQYLRDGKYEVARHIMNAMQHLRDAVALEVKYQIEQERT